jgi:outer membrane protein assembly factor BamB
VRLRAAQGLIAGKDKEAVPTLIALLDHAALPIAYRAEDLLCRIAGERAPPVWLAAGQEEERRKCRMGWDAWWREHGLATDLAKVDIENRFLGLTMICTCDGYKQNKGRVWEIGPDGKVRWEISDVAYPVDAQMLPGNRVLIAEQQAGCLTERDLKGNVLWKHVTKGNVVGCQRLRNGNTFVVTNNLLYEITPAQKVVATYPGHRGTVYAALKLRNGNVVYLSSTYLFTELDRTGKELRSLKIDMAGIGLVKPEELTEGRFLVGQRKELIEVDGTGKNRWEARVESMVSAQRLPNGHTLAASDLGHRVVEVDRAGKVVWEERLKGSPVRVRRR